MTRELLFYEKDEFFDYKELKFTEGYSIESISKFIKDTELINKLEINSVITDISALSEFISIQTVGEQTISLFDGEMIFICDIKHKSILSYELRHVFENYNSVEKSDVKSKIKIDENEIIGSSKKIHRKIIDLDEDELNVFFEKFKDKLYGHPKFKDDFENQIKTFRIFNKLKEHKILSFFLLGDSGVGKTEVARTIFKSLGGTKKIAKINFGNYSNEFSLSSLIGASRGYRDSDDGEIFMKVRDTDVGVLLIDEFEKSNTTLFNYFLDVLETGIIEGSLGQQIDLNGFIIIFTSNISKEDFPKRISPELRSRFDYKSQFTVLGNSDKEKYVEFRLADLSKKVKIEFEIELPENALFHFLTEINVSKFKNMRDVNKKLKKTLVKYIEEILISKEIIIPETSKPSFSERIRKILKK